MLKKDIQIGTKYAVRIPNPRNPRQTQIVGMQVTALSKSVVEGVVDACLVNPLQRVRTRQVLRTWAEHQALEAEKQAADQVRQERAQQRAAEAAAEDDQRRSEIKAWVGTFSGMMVPAESVSSANFSRPDVDLGAEMERILVTNRAESVALGYEALKVVAQTITQLREQVLAQGGSWVAPDAPEWEAPGPTRQYFKLDDEELYDIVLHGNEMQAGAASSLMEERAAQRLIDQRTAAFLDEILPEDPDADQ